MYKYDVRINKQISTFILGVELAVLRLIRILEKDPPLFRTEIWQDRKNAAAKIYSYLCTYGAPSPGIRGPINDNDVYEVLEKILRDSSYPFFCKYNVFLDDLSYLITRFRFEYARNFSNPSLLSIGNSALTTYDSTSPQIIQLEAAISKRFKEIEELERDLVPLRKATRYKWTTSNMRTTEYQREKAKFNDDLKQALSLKEEKFKRRYQKKQSGSDEFLICKLQLQRRIEEYEAQLSLTCNFEPK